MGAGPQQVNFFLGAIGEPTQRMADPDAVYGLALPDNRQYRGLVDPFATPCPGAARTRRVLGKERWRGWTIEVQE